MRVLDLNFKENMYELPGTFLTLINRLLEHLKERDRKVNEMELDIQPYHRERSRGMAWTGSPTTLHGREEYSGRYQ